MKKIIALLLTGILALALFACGGDTPDKPTESNNTNPTQASSGTPGDIIEEIYFESAGVRIEVGVLPEPILEALGEPEKTFESKSCALNAKDINYKYNGFVLTVTYPEKGDNYIAVIKLPDDACKIPGGITIGSTFEDVTAAYGMDYKESTGFFTYSQGLDSLEFSIEDGKVNQIKYVYDFINA